MAKDTACVCDGVGGLVIVHDVVYVLGVGFGERLTVMRAHPEIAVVGRLVAFDVCSELLTDGEGYD